MQPNRLHLYHNQKRNQGSLLKNYIAEFLGTYVLVTIGTGTIALTNADPLTVSLAFGLAFMVCAYTFGSYSGGPL
ncbi:aquaporin [Secundilactobacillus collinoides]|uniref:aquaporin n=1 Tax=Secundilactobacillus collinoides TaxID=33960 RepID=UPI000B155B36